MTQPDSTVEFWRWALSVLIIPTLILVTRISWVMGKYTQKVDDIDKRVERLEGREPVANHGAD